jgi:hypothetical protein
MSSLLFSFFFYSLFLTSLLPPPSLLNSFALHKWTALFQHLKR